MNESKGVKAGANFSEVALFALRFNSINFCFPGVGVTTDGEKADNPNTGAADADKPGKGTVDPKKVNKAKVDRADKPSTSIVDLAEVDRAEADRAKTDRADKPDTSIADPLVEADRMDKSDRVPAD